MSCSSAEEFFAGLLDGNLSGALRADVLAHVERCSTCTGVLEELRVVDALLIEPRRIDLAADFTAATMAHARTLPAPAARRTPVLAYLVCYVVGAWLIAGTALVFAPQSVHGFVQSASGSIRAFAETAGGLSRAAGRGFGRDANAAAVGLIALLLLDGLLVLSFVAALKYLQPRAERLRF